MRAEYFIVRKGIYNSLYHCGKKCIMKKMPKRKINMKLEKYKIQEGKLGFICLCLLFFIGLILITKLTDLTTETVEIEAVVTNTWERRHSGFVREPIRPKMNIEWVDLNGEVQTEGGLANRRRLNTGDSFTISVDAKTQSRRVLSKAGCAFLFALGSFCCIVSLKLLKLFYGKEKR